ncbi:MAG: Conserved hypothetical secreted protein [Microgenomates group bacterium GW2011_GWC1_41_8]|uniref:Conserved hypothetical secreted protein n=2 Tax=Candidatus Roizmaniibacteriota TaxID=1752723 RepID=A0A0G0T2D5_9BACT|nr:MAG: Conserved hypothetical secreted protein [Candidatus Levybacteria bacterium GW2011_GWA2_40_16]KKR71203.1 MAG: Conserved hypothetical secreted protein [Candidatus Roizmanbacteria bacterium GW2011_GWB1_40_7]KKR94412.1 MAG: Conserved hypothetical secreted protein [Candidatus Roizmanbacteria bacterium GW2011_GWA1_41_13]KKS23854.1 MAG: Conserved hypothetical secreted protein [Microgenomates group bacterium GW2011_GWC1_41_8]OGK49839.1 MAG: hypothetical protein A3A55_01990 [Candidatus Roizmanba
MTNRRFQKGLTLIEALIAVAIFAIFALLVNSIFFNILRGTLKQESLKDVKQSGSVAMEIMEKTIREAESVTCNASSSITTINPDGTSTTTFQISTDAITGTTGTNVNKLTGEKVRVNSLAFTCDNTGVYPVVTITFILEHINNTTNPNRAEGFATMDFRTTVSLR